MASSYPWPEASRTYGGAPEWPDHLPAPTAEYGISEDGSDVPDMWLKSGDRKVYMQARLDQNGNWYDDIHDDPDWQSESFAIRDQAVTYGRWLMDRYLETIGDMWGSDEGRAFMAAIRARLAA